MILNDIYINLTQMEALPVKAGARGGGGGGPLKHEMANSPVNLGIFEAQHQTNCNRIVFNAM